MKDRLEQLKAVSGGQEMIHLLGVFFSSLIVSVSFDEPLKNIPYRKKESQDW